MIKKTKSQKIIAELRRKIKAAKIATPTTSITTPTSSTSLETKPQVSVIKKPEISMIPTNSSVFIKKDLFKTVFFSLIVITLELMLYWAFEVNNQKMLVSLLGKKIF